MKVTKPHSRSYVSLQTRSTPVLATLLAFVSGTQDPVQGGGLLLAYTTGYVTPLLVAATVAVS